MGVRLQETNRVWYGENYHYLMGAIASIHYYLDRYIAVKNGQDLIPTAPPQRPRWSDAPPALVTLSDRFHLSDFEENILLLCVGRALHPRFRELYAIAQDQPDCTYPTFHLALNLLPEPHWQAFTPDAPLRHWQLLHLANGEDITHSRLQIDEGILHYLMGEPYRDSLLAGVIEPCQAQILPLPPSHVALTEDLRRILAQPGASVQLCGSDPEQAAAIAQHLSQNLGRSLYGLKASALPTDLAAVKQLVSRWQRWATLAPNLLLIEQDSNTTHTAALQLFLQTIPGGAIVATPERITVPHCTLAPFDLPRLGYSEQLHLWEAALGNQAQGLNGQLQGLVAQFNLSAATIQAASQVPHAGASAQEYAHHLWAFCRNHARPKIEHLAQRMETLATWDELILPPREKGILRAIAAQVQQRAKVYEEWGFGRKGQRGLGISALFAGPSGTGKTMAAEVIAREFRLDLYRIDLSAVSSKYIGETEKNLRQIFDAAEAGGAVLLFDEADALFGKRTQVKDSHDRHANLEVSYLLQRMEAYQGLAILTTNLKDSLDEAFLRRLRFIINFPFPNQESRGEIWRHIFPFEMPSQNLNHQLLGQLDVAGGNIRSIAMNAAFIAAHEGEPVQMKHILEGAKAEYLKLGRSLTPAEIIGWIDSD
ncbi:ATP-binding protein [Spirulina sp. CCNP1310]|uniref:ATP-binding protein n=1 Tax=Spirulina sp. CCNP1310 TaxID=3110249 RepID=UPI002B21A212|nr:ATP-binding protein [Spirulina sp. CCNP1310]MEA5418553.1 ATP-binding protein [Spirulina sp. CCNP1310]